VEGLLEMYEQTGDFLQKPLVERLAEGVAALEEAAETARNPSTSHKSGGDLGFLSPSEQPGSLGKLGHYEVQEVIGSGGMGIVLRAFDERLHRVVAIKVMAAPLATNAAARKRFQREARAAAAVCHDHIVTIHAVEESGDLPYLVMQCVAGMSLQQRIDRDGPLALHEILRVGMQTAAGLAAAHAQGLIHRDIKPANILLENGVERVKITDFGLARAAADASVTQTGIVAGTPQYMAPEQARGEALDCRTDLFSLGSVLYAMSTGRAPFRAANSMAALKRVCDDATSPIREANADVPQWLIELIDKLQAKNPDDRYQSAAEVADLLGRRLAQLQHSTPLPPLAPAKPAPSRRAAQRLRTWAVAAAVLLAILATFAIAEGTGVTQVAATVIRLMTPDGTLVVETDDPAVKVTVEGDGGLVITGAGLEEIRLRPGSYRVQADRNGKPVALDKDLVTVSRGGRAIVKVKLETPPAVAAAKVEKGAFVLLGGKGIEVRKYDSLAEAVQGASDGDTIEIRGNGPFVTQPISITQALIIRAGEGFVPVIKADPQEQGMYLLQTNSHLVLEGLDLQWVDATTFDPPGRSQRLVLFSGSTSRLQAANCRFLMNRQEGLHGGMECIAGWGTPLCRLRNCQLLIGGHGKVWGTNLEFTSIPNGEVIIDNCLIVGNGMLLPLTHAEPMKVVQNHNTFQGSPSSHLGLQLAKKIDPPPGKKDSRPLQMETSANIFGGHVWFSQLAQYRADVNVLSTREVEQLLTQLIGWRENRNLYFIPDDCDLLVLVDELTPGEFTRPSPTAPLKTLADWKGFWGMTEIDSLRGQARFQGGDLLAKAGLTPEMLTPDDFRLRADSAGYRAGKDGKDLGADVDLVGPGPAYERWKKTPEYQQWLKDTGQVTKTEAPKTEPQAFVLLGLKGVELRKFDTLPEAVQNAGEGDTIEIRGNGPFVTEPIKIALPLTIRAGEGFRPVIKLSPEGLQADAALLKTEAALVLEGLELQRMAQDMKEGPPWQAVLTTSKDLHVANCRFLMRKTWNCINNSSPVSELRNCEFLRADNHGDAVVMLTLHQTGKRLVIDNCLLTAFARVNTHEQYKAKGAVQLTRNTFRTRFGAFWFSQGLDKAPSPKDLDQRAKVLSIEASGNILDASFVFQFVQEPPEKRLPTSETASHLAHAVGWVGERNLYAVDGPFGFLNLATTVEPTTPVKNLVDWRQFWATAEANSIEGRVRYQGGDLLAKLVAAPEQLTPEDFRLRPDSAGYKAGKDGKDLGADVDLVGPGPAYERWKTTPEYQEWLQELEQAKK